MVQNILHFCHLLTQRLEYNGTPADVLPCILPYIVRSTSCQPVVTTPSGLHGQWYYLVHWPGDTMQTWCKDTPNLTQFFICHFHILLFLLSEVSLRWLLSAWRNWYILLHVVELSWFEVSWYRHHCLQYKATARRKNCKRHCDRCKVQAVTRKFEPEENLLQ